MIILNSKNNNELLRQIYDDIYQPNNAEKEGCNTAICYFSVKQS